MLLKQSTARKVAFLMVLSSDHVTGATGKTVTCNLSKDGSAFGAAGGAVTEISSGWYYVSLNTADTNTVGDLAFDCTASGCDNTDFVRQVTARLPDDLAYPATTGRSMVVDAAGLVDANAVKVGPTGSGTAQTARDLGASVLLSSGTGTGQLSFASGVVQADAAKINGVATTSVATINANLGQTQPVNFTGTGASALVKGDAVDIAGVVPGSATIGTVTNLTNAPTSGDFTATMKTSIGTAVAASAVASVTAGVTLAASQHVIVDSGTVTTLTNLPSIPANWLTAAGIAAGALNGKGDWSTYAGGDTSGTTTLLARIPGTVQPQTGDSYARLGAPAGASIAADLAEIEAETDTLLAGVTVSDKTGFSLASTGLDLVLVAGKTLPNALKYIGAVCAGVIGGAGSGTETFQDFAGATAVTVTVDSSGNRSAVVLA